jgi:hypothetical protein
MALGINYGRIWSTSIFQEEYAYFIYDLALSFTLCHTGRVNG